MLIFIQFLALVPSAPSPLLKQWQHSTLQVSTDSVILQKYHLTAWIFCDTVITVGAEAAKKQIKGLQ